MISPPSSFVLVNFTSVSAFAIFPSAVPPSGVTINPAAVSSSTVYSTSVGRPSAVSDSPSASSIFATPLVNFISPYVPLIVLSFSVTVNLNFFVLSLAVELVTVLETFRFPVSRVFVNSAVAVVSATVPSLPDFSVVNPAASVSSTLYVMPVGSPVTDAVSPLASSTSALPSLNVSSPYLPLILLSLSVTVNVNFFVLSADASDTTVFLTSNPPVLRVFVNSAVFFSEEIVPVSPDFSVVNPSTDFSSTVYSTP